MSEETVHRFSESHHLVAGRIEALQKRVAELEQHTTTLRQERDQAQLAHEQLLRVSFNEQTEWKRREAMLTHAQTRLRELLQLIMPMAKAYAAMHPIGSNQEYVNRADAALTGETDG